MGDSTDYADAVAAFKARLAAPRWPTLRPPVAASGAAAPVRVPLVWQLPQIIRRPLQNIGRRWFERWTAPKAAAEEFPTPPPPRPWFGAAENKPRLSELTQVGLAGLLAAAAMAGFGRYAPKLNARLTQGAARNLNFDAAVRGALRHYDVKRLADQATRYSAAPRWLAQVGLGVGMPIDLVRPGGIIREPVA